MKLRPGIAIIIIIILSILTRLPLLKSEFMVLDLDECAVGMMAAHQYEGKEIAPYFWGQAYGFTLVETTAICISYAFGGISDEAVKLPMLALWIIGVIFFYLTLLQINKKGSLTPHLIILLFILSPAWAIWSMKARGGYLTAFMLSSVLLYLLFHRKYGSKDSTYLTAGILLSVIFESQAIWIPGLMPLVFYKLVQEHSKKKWAYLMLTGLVCFTGFALYKMQLPHNHNPHIFSKQHFWSNFLRIPGYLFHNQHGMYFFHYLKTPNFYTSVFAITFSVLVSFLLITGVYQLAGKRKDALFPCSTLAIVLTLFYTVFTIEVEPRYLLPTTGLALFSLQVWLNYTAKKKYIHAFLLALSFWGAVATYSLRDFSFCNTRKKDLDIAIQYLLDKGVHHVYCPDWILHWQIMFYSHEKILTRRQDAFDRCTAYSQSVDKALYLHKPIALVIFYDYNANLPITPIKVPGFDIYDNPSSEQLQTAGFRLWPESQFFPVLH